MTSLLHALRTGFARLLPVLALCLCLALPALAHENGGDGGGGAGGGSEGNAAEASEAANDAKDAAAAAEEAMEAVSAAGSVGGVAGTVALSSPGQGVTASSGGATEGISAMDRAAMDALSINPSAWSPF